MSITVPSDGDPITAVGFGTPVANLFNQIILLCMTADVSKTSNTYSDVTGLTFPVVNGKTYNLDLTGHWTGDTSTGISIGANFPSGTFNSVVALHYAVPSGGSGTVWTERVNATDTMTGVSASTTSAMSWRMQGRYVCTADGTFAVRYKRNGTSATVAILAGSGGLVIQSA